MSHRPLPVATCTLVLMLAIASPAFAGQGTVHLHNGGRINGEIMEIVPGERVSVRLADGTVRTVPCAEIKGVDESIAPAPAPAPPAAPYPPAAVPYLPQQPPPPPAGAAPAPEDRLPVQLNAAQRSRRRSLALFGAAGLGGTLRVQVEGIQGGSEAGFDATFGGGVQFDWPIVPYFSIGGIARALSFAVEGSSRGTFVDFAFTPRVRFPFPLGSQWGAVYLQLAVGFGLVDRPDFNGTDDGNVATALFGTGAGVQLMFTRRIGVVFEVGWQHRIWLETYETPEDELDAIYDGGQLMLEAGPLIAF